MKTSATKAQASHRLPDSTPARSRARGDSQNRITSFLEPGPGASSARYALEDARHQSGGAHLNEDGYDRGGGRDAGI